MAITGRSSTTAQLEGFAKQLLAAIGAPATSQNVDWIVAWSRAEASTAANNPLDTTLRTSGSYALPGNTAGVQQYPSETAGVQATSSTLLESYYPAVVADFRQGSIVTAYSNDPKLLPELETWGGGASYWQSVASVAGSGSLPAGSSVPPPTTTSTAAPNPADARSLESLLFGSPIGDIESLTIRALFGAAGVALIVLALILLSKAVTGRNLVAVGAGFVGGRVEGQRSEKRKEAERQTTAQRASERHTVAVAHGQARVKTEQARATELRTRTKHRRRAKQEQTKAEERAYVRGATDQAHHTNG